MINVTNRMLYSGAPLKRTLATGTIDFMTRCPLLRVFECIEVYGDMVWTFRYIIVPAIVRKGTIVCIIVYLTIDKRGGKRDRKWHL